MKNNSNLKININEEEICLNKITVVSGVNGSGKSTVSRTLYCFLKTLSPAIDQFVFKKFVENVNKFIKDYINSNENYHGKDLYDHFKVKNDYSTILSEFYKAKSIFLKNQLDKNYNQNEKFHYDFISRRITELIDLIETRRKDSIFRKLHLLAFDEVTEIEGVTLQGDNFKFVTDNLKETYFNGKYIVPDVFYVDNISILDLKHGGKAYLEHVGALEDNLDYEIMHVKELPEDMKKILEKIELITQGTYPVPDDDYYFSKDEDMFIVSQSVPSGIKQIGIIWMLLANFKLQNGSFLIFDEPEVNLHPEWQFKFAEILVALVKDLDINIYLNTHSPMFIEFIDAFCEYYDMENDVNYYMAEKTGVDYDYKFNKIDSNELYKIYDNLGNGYKLVNQLRIRKRLSK